MSKVILFSGKSGFDGSVIKSESKDIDQRFSSKKTSSFVLISGAEHHYLSLTHTCLC